MARRDSDRRRDSDPRPLWYRQLLQQYERELQIAFVLWVTQLKADMLRLEELPIAANDIWWTVQQRRLELVLRPLLHRYAVEGSNRQMHDLDLPVGFVTIGNNLDVWATRRSFDEARLIVDETVRAVDLASEHAAEAGLSDEETKQLVGGQTLGLNRQQVAGVVGRTFEGVDTSDHVNAAVLNRAELIGANNAVDSLNEGMFAAAAFLDSGGHTITKTWITAADERVCNVCFPLHGQEVPLRQDFVIGSQYIEKPKAHHRCRCGIGYRIHGDPISGELVA